MSEFIRFPNGFLWGTATSAYQIEGAVNEDGRGQSIWDVFSNTPGKIVNDDNGDSACNHYHLWKEDINLMKDLGYKAYRFSISWPRIIPTGQGKINPAGLDFYNRLVDELLKADITPMATLYHWDLPVAFAEGWLNRSTSDAFVEYTGVAVHAFGDRVKKWITINEPYCASHLSYTLGIHAPGMHDTLKALKAAHNLLLAHGMAVPVIRANCQNAEVGIAVNLSPFTPQTQSKADRFAARHKDGVVNRWFLDPLYGRHYPMDIVSDYIKLGVLNSEQADYIQEKDFVIIAVPTDFLGINYYSRSIVHAVKDHEIEPGKVKFMDAPEENKTDIGWEIYPQGLFEIISLVHRDYTPGKIYITENGASYADGPDHAGKIHDIKRISYLNKHIGAIGKAIHSGVPVAGYFLWSFLDNFEWSFGYTQRFGLIYVDYSDLRRYPKESAAWYQQVIEHNGIEAS
jgi:beta-glucosidase